VAIGREALARICIIRQGSYPLDPRVRREVTALEALGHDIDVICLQRPGQSRRESSGRVTVYRLPLARKRGSPLRYLFEYAAFAVGAALLVSVLHLRHAYRLIQVNSMPDALVFAALGPRLLGRARVVLDLHECVPEFLASKYRLSARHPAVKLAQLAEQASIRFCDLAITCTDQMRDRFIERGAHPDKISVVLNAADEEIFDPARTRPPTRVPGRLVLISHGSVAPLYGLDTAIRAVALLRGDARDISLQIYGIGPALEELRELARELDLGDSVYFSGRIVSLAELVSAISSADAGVVANRRDVFRDLTHCNKMYDFIAMRKPVICSRTDAVQAYFDDDCFQYFTAGDEHDLARAIDELYERPELGETKVRRAAEVCEPYRWAHQRRAYQTMLSSALS
jgi:glycosyltransferase involved in cell wall biosynthesis